jgi:F5/8 type C domain
MSPTPVERARHAALAQELLLQAQQVVRERPPHLAPHIRAGLWRDAARWALLALAPPGTSFSHAFAAVASQLGEEARRTVLETDVLSDATLSAEALDAELKLRERTAVALVALAAPQEPPAVGRIARWGAIGILAALVAFVGVATARWALSKPDLAEGKPWRASSALVECHPSRHECGGTRTEILFHTREQVEPWFEIDLSAPQRFSEVVVRNRPDCCRERAVPLILEVSDDQLSWKQLARQDRVFDDWVARFAPVTARFVRLRVPHSSMLHLEGVWIHA